MLVFPLRIPFENVSAPENVCVNPDPRANVPPAPFIVNAPPVIFPVSVAAPPVLVIETPPVVVKPAISCVAEFPVIVTAELPAVSVPLLLT